MTLPLIRVRGVSAGYRRHQVFDGLDLDVPAGITVLLGPNGAGKSTLLNMLAGLHDPSVGTITFPNSTGDRRGRAALLPQTFGYLRGFTLAEFVSYVAWLKMVPKSTRTTSVATAIAAVNLTDRTDDKMRTLSGGMVRRAGIAAALVSEPGILLLDEPAAGLDPLQRMELQRVLTGLAPGTSTFLSTHLAEDVEDFAAAVIILDRGDLLFSGTPAALIAEAGAQAAKSVTTVTQAYLQIMQRSAAESI